MFRNTHTEEENKRESASSLQQELLKKKGLDSKIFSNTGIKFDDPLSAHAAFVFKYIYAFPYNQNNSTEKNLLAREVHGIQHASRVAIFIVIFASLWKKYSHNEAKEIDDAANKYKKNVMIGMNFRFRPDTMLLKSLISSGELGDVFYIKCGWTRPQSSSQKWFTNKSLSGGGVLLDLGIVLLDTALWLLDYPKIKTSSAQNFYHSTQPLEDSSIGFIRLANSSVIHYEASWAVQDEANIFKLAAFGTKGTGHLNPLRAYKKIASTKVDLTINPFSQVKSLFNKSYENEIKHFIGVVRDSIPVISSIEEALSIMKLVENLYGSAKNKIEISN